MMKPVFTALVFSFIPLLKAAADPIRGYETNWVDPIQHSVYHASLGCDQAKLLLDAQIFDVGDTDKQKAQLQLFHNSKLLYSEKFGSNRGYRGPWLIQNQKKDNSIIVDIESPSASVYQAYEFDPVLQQYKKIETELKGADAASAAVPIDLIKQGSNAHLSANLKTVIKDGEFANWTLELRKRKSVAWSTPVSLTEYSLGRLSSGLKHWDCRGPFVGSLDGKSTQIDLRLEPVFDINFGKGCGTFYSERIYYFDRISKKLRSSSHSWGENNPRLADLLHNGQIEFITEDWQLEHDAWLYPGTTRSGMFGPLQIWKWSKNKLVDVTLDFPAEIRKHAEVARKHVESKDDWYNYVDSCLLSYVGDLCHLGEKKKALAELERLKTPFVAKMHQQVIQQLKKHKYL